MASSSPMAKGFGHIDQGFGLAQFYYGDGIATDKSPNVSVNKVRNLFLWKAETESSPTHARRQMHDQM
jgi:hypothetical protein